MPGPPTFAIPSRVRRFSVVLPALVLALGLAGAVVAAPVSVADLLRLADAGAGEKLLSRVVDERGLSGEVGVEDILVLKKAGFSDAFIEELIDGGAPGLASSSVSVREEGGVLVVEGRGTPSEAAPGAPPQAESHARATSASASPAPPVVVVQQAAPASDASPHVPERSPERSLGVENPYPVGATFGVSGGAVFLPARFGDPPSAFGRTIILGGVLGGLSPWGHHGLAGHGGHHGHSRAVTPVPHHVRAPGSFNIQTGHATGATTTIRTSRGTRRIPN